MGASVFISHAEKDSALANALTNLLLTGVGLKQEQIFCSSLAGLGIPAGEDFKGYIGDRLSDAPIVIALLTPNYYASAFCLCEAGATWILSKDFVPLVAPTTKFSEMKAVLQGTQALCIDEETSLDEMRQRLESLVQGETKDAWWTVKKKEFLHNLPSVISSLEKPATPSAKEYAETVAERDAYREVGEDLESRLAALQKKYDALAALKDAEAVQALEIEACGEQEQFDSLVKEVSRALVPLSSGVIEALYQQSRGEKWYPSDEWGNRLTDDIERGLL